MQGQKEIYFRRSEGDFGGREMRMENGALMLAGILKHPRLRKCAGQKTNV